MGLCAKGPKYYASFLFKFTRLIIRRRMRDVKASEGSSLGFAVFGDGCDRLPGSCVSLAAGLAGILWLIQGCCHILRRNRNANPSRH